MHKKMIFVPFIWVYIIPKLTLDRKSSNWKYFFSITSALYVSKNPWLLQCIYTEIDLCDSLLLYDAV